MIKDWSFLASNDISMCTFYNFFWLNKLLKIRGEGWFPVLLGVLLEPLPPDFLLLRFWQGTPTGPVGDPAVVGVHRGSGGRADHNGRRTGSRVHPWRRHRTPRSSRWTCPRSTKRRRSGIASWSSGHGSATPRCAVPWPTARSPGTASEARSNSATSVSFFWTSEVESTTAACRITAGLRDRCSLSMDGSFLVMGKNSITCRLWIITYWSMCERPFLAELRSSWSATERPLWRNFLDMEGKTLTLQILQRPSSINSKSVICWSERRWEGKPLCCGSVCGYKFLKK